MAQTSTTSPQQLRMIKTLVELHPDEKVYQGVDSDGGLVFRQKLREGHEGHQGTKAVRPQGIIALGLTEVCCDIGVGKVYYVPMLDAFPKDLKLSHHDEEDQATLTVIHGFYRISRLLYAHMAWTAQEREDWMAMKHEDRLAVLNARGGALRQRDLVMPISFEYDPIEKEAFKMTAYFRGSPGFRAFLAIVPKAYLGWNVDFDRLCSGCQLSDRGPVEFKGAWNLMDPSTLQEYLMTDAEQVVRTLDRMFFEGRECSVTLLSDVLRAVKKFYRAYHGDPDGDRLPPDEEEGPVAGEGT